MANKREDTIKTKIELSGEKAYKQACTQINAELRELSSEMKLLSSQYDDNADSMEALQKEQGLYNKQLAEQQKKIDAAEKALKELEEAGNGSTEAARRLRIELNRNQAAYNETNKKVKSLADEIDKSKNEYKEYTTAASKIDDTLAELSSEMKVLAEETKDSADSADTLRRKHDGLEKIFSEQEKKVSALEKAYAAAAKDGDKLGKEAHDIKIALNDAKAAAAKTENEMRTLEKALDNAADEAQDADEGFSDLGESLGELGGPLAEAEDALNGLAKKFSVFGIDASKFINPTTVALGGLAFGLFELGKTAVEFAEETNKSLISFSAQTTAATEDMAEYEAVMLDLYSGGYGEGMEDIADAMARVAQVTGTLEPDKLGDMAKGALTLRDAFGIDVAESIRGVNQLVNIFGVDGARAFDMVALAARLGLDQNGNLMDTLNEYAIHYQQLGLSVEDMFASLVSAQESGVFDIDKVGDAIKEFGIRVREGGDEVREVFEAMGFNADDMVDAFNAGGEAAAGAMNQVLGALFSIEDETLRNQMGLALFGSQWEDLGNRGVQAATDFDAALGDAAGTLEGINNQKFDTISGQWDLLMRNLNTALQPIGEAFSNLITDALKAANEWLEKWNAGETDLQKLNDFIVSGDAKVAVGDWVRENAPWLKNMVVGETVKHGSKIRNHLEGFEPFEVSIGFTADEKTFAEQLGIIRDTSTEPIMLAGKRQGDAFVSGIAEGIGDGSQDTADTARQAAELAAAEAAQAYPGFEESGAWVIQGMETGMEEGAPGAKRKAGEIADGTLSVFHNQDQAMRAAGMSWLDSAARGFEASEGELKTRLQTVIDHVVSQIAATVHISAVVGATAAFSGQPSINVTQQIYADNTSYDQQQRKAAKAIQNVVRSLT